MRAPGRSDIPPARHGFALRLLLPLLPLLSWACVQPRGLGPDLGACAAPPAGVHTFGQVGIGTCLSGPADLRFFAQDGKDWLAVTNANPQSNFATGSLLLIDWASIDPTREVNYLHEVDAYAIDLDAYVGGLGYVADPGKQVVMVAGRLSDDARTRSEHDTLHVVDVSDPTDPRPWALGDRLTLRDDPMPMEVHPEFQRAYVGNITDHSISVLDTSGAPIREIDVAPQVELSPGVFVDADASGSTAELSLTLLDATRVPDDRWQLSWVEGSQRLWVPDQGGLQRYNYGGGDYVPAFALDLDPSESVSVDLVHDAFYSPDFAVPQMLFSDDGVLWAIPAVAASFWDWSAASVILRGGGSGAWDAWLDAPAVLRANGVVLFFHDAREAEGEPASIALAVADGSGAATRFAEPILSPSGDWVSYEDPFVRNDVLAQRYRMWLSLWNGERWSLGLSESGDTINWSQPTEVLAVDGDVASPAVVYTNGRYQMWFARGDGERWAIAHAWSYDGVRWHDVQDVLSVDGPYDPLQPPRPAVLSDSTGAWRVEGDARGLQSSLAVSSAEYVLGGLGFSFRPSSGYAISPSVLAYDEDPTATSTFNGILPVSAARVGGRDLLYVSTIDGSSRRGLAALEQVDGEWVQASADLIPPGEGGNAAGARGPVVVADESGATMYYAAIESDGVGRLRRATSTDGLTWTATTITAPEHGEWEAAARWPHTLEPLAGGGFRLWYTGSDGESDRIGALTSTDGVTFVADPGQTTPWQLGLGALGEFDGNGVADPHVVVIGETTTLWYAGFDGRMWAIGRATRGAGETAWKRDIDPVTGEFQSKLFGIARTFSGAGVRSPLLLDPEASAEGDVQALYGGFDGSRWRVGRAVGSLSRLFPAQRFPTLGDTLSFTTRRGDPAGGVIELEQSLDGYYVSGLGTSALHLDKERGFLYVAAKSTIRPANYLYVIDVRDDTRDGFVDSNFLDIEAILELGQTVYGSGFRDAIPIPGTDLLYATGHLPDQLVVFDLSRLVDNDRKDVIRDGVVATLPVLRVPGFAPNRPMQSEDAGIQTQARISGAGLALAPDGHTLLMAHFRDNSLIAFDLRLGAYGEEIRRIPYVGENPHVIRISPDGRYAVVANYLGDVDDQIVSSTLALIDLDPTSPDYLQVVSWIKNR